MHSSPHRHVPNMKGKKFYVFRCGCCAAFNYKAREIEKKVLKEMKLEILEGNE